MRRCGPRNRRAAMRRGDKNGLATGGEAQMTIRWTLPDGGQTVTWVDSVVRTTFEFRADGQQVECRTERSYPSPSDPELCRRLEPQALTYRGEPALGTLEGRRELVFETGSLVGEGADSLPVGRGEGLTLMLRRVIAVTRDDKDRMIECRAGLLDPIPDTVLKQACAQYALPERDSSVTEEAIAVHPKKWVFYEAVYWRPVSAATRATPAP